MVRFFTFVNSLYGETPPLVCIAFGMQEALMLGKWGSPSGTEVFMGSVNLKHVSLFIQVLYSLRPPRWLLPKALVLHADHILSDPYA
jgi:hypothetical protein